MSRYMKRMKNRSKFLVFNILKMTFFLPLSIVFISEIEGPDIHYALQNSISLLTEKESGFSIWFLLLMINFIIYVFLKPVLHYNRRCRISGKTAKSGRKKAVRVFNKLPNFILFVTIAGFFIGHLTDVIFNSPDGMSMELSLFYSSMESLSMGLFAGTLMYFNTENLLFPARKMVFTDDFAEKQKYSSFYLKLILSMTAIVFFLLFQVFDYFSSFYAVSVGKELMKDSGRNFMNGADIFELSRGHEDLQDVVKVLFLRLFIFGFYVLHLLRQIKKMFKNPLETVQQKLEGLNSNEPELSKQIDIVNNDEYTPIFREINLLIDKQNTMLERSEEQLEKIVDNAADPIISFHEDGSIHVFNPAAQKFFGYSVDELTSLNMTDLIDLPDEIRCECEENRNLFIDYISNFDTRLKRFSGRHKNGGIINFESNVSRSETDHGPLFTAILRDITGQLEFEKNLEKAKTSAENANRMKSEFLANMSHELRTPLNAVLGFTQLLSTDKNLTGGQLDKINTISRSGEHLLALINDILDISKIESGKIEMHENIFDLNQFIGDLKDMFILKCQTKGLSFYVEYAGDVPPFVIGDLGKIRQVMINLIGNAVKFTNEGGISLLVGEENGKIRFSINDTGKGIPEEEIEKILQPFMQSSNVDHEGGTGLGLAISNSFIRMMGGELDIKSEEGHGSTFSFQLPLKVSEKAPELKESRGTVSSIKGGKAVKALIVDDKVNNRLILKTMLENVGFVTMEAKNGLEAIERTEEFDPEMIFMDIKMPVMDGYESVQRLKSTERGRDIKIFALTASAFRHDEQRIFESGFDGFLPKPFKLESLFRIISDNTDVEFNYERDNSADESSMPGVRDLDYQVLAGSLSADELENFADNILINDFAAIKQFAGELQGRDELRDFIDIIRYYADNFNDQRLEEILEEIRNNQNG